MRVQVLRITMAAALAVALGVFGLPVNAPVLQPVSPALAADETVTDCADLQAALDQAVDGDTITLDALCTGMSFRLKDGVQITLEGVPGDGDEEGFDGTGAPHRVLSGLDVGTTTIRDLVFRNSTDPGSNGGGALALTGTVAPRIVNSIFQGNEAASFAGGLLITSTSGSTPDIHLTDTIVGGLSAGGVGNGAGNSAPDIGGALLVNSGDGDVFISGSNIDGNVATDSAGVVGGLLAIGGSDGGGLALSNTTLNGNMAHDFGGILAIAEGIHLSEVSANDNVAVADGSGGVGILGAGELISSAASVSSTRSVEDALRLATSRSDALGLGQLDRDSLTPEAARERFGAVHPQAVEGAAAGDLVVENSTFDGNDMTDGSAAALLTISEGTTWFTQSSISNNSAASIFAGAELIALGDLNLLTNTISNNITDADGDSSGVLPIGLGPVTRVENNTISGNQAGPDSLGAGVLGIGVGTFNVRNNSVNDNITAGEGGGLWLVGGADLELSGNSIAMNRALTTSDLEGIGGGAFLSAPVLRIHDNAIESNDATSDGGGLWAEASVATSVAGNTFQGNASGDDGGGLYYAGASCETVEVNDNTFSGNELRATDQARSDREGGGLWLDNSSCEVTMSNNLFDGNVVQASPPFAETQGGGAWIAAGQTQSTNDTFTNNTVNGDNAEGGGLWVLDRVFDSFIGRNLVSAGNTIGTGSGGGIYADSSGSTAVLALQNSTVSGNTAGTGAVAPGIGGGEDEEHLHLTNTIVAANTGGTGPDIAGFEDVDAVFSDACMGAGFTGGAFPGDGNICADPALVGGDDVHQTNDSPTLDAGSNALVPAGLDEDFEGDDRIIDADGDGTATVDMGADEALPANLSVVKTASPTEVEVGDTVTYEITVTNEGPGVARDVTVTDDLPAGTTFNSATPSSGGSCTTPAVGTNGTVTCTWEGDTAAGAERTVTIVATVVEEGDLTNSATATALTVDDDDSDDTGSVEVLSGAATAPPQTPPGSIDPDGYCLVAEDSGVFAFGECTFFGTASATQITPVRAFGIIAPSLRELVAPIVAAATTPDDGGYWQVAADGGVFAFGNAGFFGSMGGVELNQPIVGMAATPTGQGYWMVASDGGIFSFGDATFHGSTGNIALNQPIVAMAATPSGAGYWFVASDGGVFSFGDATFHGSTGAITLNQPVVSMASTPGGKGYWLAATDGGVFSFGDATFHGSTGAITLNQPIRAIRGTPDGGGYWMAATDGGIFTFGNAVFHGSTGDIVLNQPIVDMIG